MSVSEISKEDVAEAIEAVQRLTDAVLDHPNYQEEDSVESIDEDHQAVRKCLNYLRDFVR